jgi:DNA-binding transcriptional MocR family regulator
MQGGIIPGCIQEAAYPDNPAESQALDSALAFARHFPPSARISAPKGAVILWVQLEVDGMEVFHEARRHRIFVLPGIISEV